MEDWLSSVPMLIGPQDQPEFFLPINIEHDYSGILAVRLTSGYA
jgi:hypothetical protein